MGLKISYKDQLVFITGGTRGIGAEIVKEIAACEGNIIFTGTCEIAPEWLSELEKQYPQQTIKYVKMDFTDSQWIDELKKLIDCYPDISVCINNAGINIVSDIRDVQIEDLKKVLEVNLVTPAIITSYISCIMTLKKYGRIVNISSIFGITSRLGRSTYSASKFGLIGQTKACALDLAKDNILVNAVCPGFTLTDLTKRTLGEEGIKQVSKEIPVGRLAKPEEIVPAVLFLASDLNTYITGQTLIVDGGLLAE